MEYSNSKVSMIEPTIQETESFPTDIFGLEECWLLSSAHKVDFLPILMSEIATLTQFTCLNIIFDEWISQSIHLLMPVRCDNKQYCSWLLASLSFNDVLYW